MTDTTEGIRRILVQEINSRLPFDEQERYAELVKQYGEDNVFDTQAVQEHFEVLGFMAPFVVAIRKADNVKGSMEFCHSPRFYYDFRPV